MNKQGIIDKYAARLLMVSFFLPMIVQVQVVGAVSLYFVSRVIIARQSVPRRNYLLALIIGSSYLLYLLSFPITPPEYRPFLMTLSVRSVSFLLLPFVFAIITPAFSEVIRREMIYFVYACLISSALGSADYMYHYWAGKTVLPTLNHVEYRMFFEAVTGIHPTYMSMYLCFSVCILLLPGAFNFAVKNIVRYSLVYVLILLLLSLLSKAPLIAMVIIFAHYSYINRKTLADHKMLVVSMVAGIIIACFVIPFARQRIGEIPRFFLHGKSGSGLNSIGEREMIVNTDMDVLKQYWLTGIGPARVLHKLHEHYFFISLSRQRPVGYFDPHNEYFFQWLSFGILGVLFFIFILAVHLIKAIRAKDHLYLYLLILLYVTFFTETVLSRQQGVVFYALFTSFFFFRNTLQKE